MKAHAETKTQHSQNKWINKIFKNLKIIFETTTTTNTLVFVSYSSFLLSMNSSLLPTGTWTPWRQRCYLCPSGLSQVPQRRAGHPVHAQERSSEEKKEGSSNWELPCETDEGIDWTHWRLAQSRALSMSFSFPLLTGTLLKTSILFARPVLIPVTTALIKYHGDWTSFLELLQKTTSIWGLQTTEFYSLTALGTRSLKSRWWQSCTPSKNSMDKSFVVSLGFWWFLAVPIPLAGGGIPPISGSVLTLPFLLIRTPGVGFKTHPQSRMISLLNPFNSIISEENFFPNKVTHTGSGASQVATW